mgnify:CR=1 FL=1
MRKRKKVLGMLLCMGLVLMLITPKYIAFGANNDLEPELKSELGEAKEDKNDFLKDSGLDNILKEENIKEFNGINNEKKQINKKNFD